MQLNLGICIAFIFIIVTIAFSFFIKKKEKKEENKIFGKMIIITILGLIIETIIYYNIVYKGILDIKIYNILIKILYTYYCLWMYHFILYNFVIFKKNSKIRKIIISISYLIFIIISIILPIEIELNNLYIFPKGIGTTAQYIIFASGMLFIIITSFTNIKTYKSKQVIPLVACFILGIFSTIIQYYHHEYLFIVPSHALALVLMYFTIENPDLKTIEELKKNRSLTSKSYIEKSNFLFRMSAEVRKPIDNIGKLNNYNLESNDIKEIKENSSLIDLNVRDASFTLNNILDVTSLDSKKINIVKNEKYSIIKLLNEIKLRESKKINNIRFEFNISENLPEYLYGDSIRLKQVLTTIIDKSINDTKEGFIEINVNSINKYDVCRLIITIENSSKPLSLEEINNILNMDNEINEEDVNEIKIDLKIVNKIINMMNGTLMIKADNGNEFTIVVDSIIVEAKKEEIINETDILLVSNNEELLKKLENLFNSYTINTVLNGIDMIDLIRSGESYNLIIIDDEMKPISGLETLKKLKELDINIPCIIMLDEGKEKIKNHYIKDGFIDYILKNNLKEEVNKIIRKML